MKLTDCINLGLLWLSLGLLVLAYLNSNTSMTKTLWFVMLMVLLLSFLSSNVLVFYLMFELSLIPILAMILFQGNQPERLSAGMYFLMYTSVLSFPYLVLLLFIMPSYTDFWNVSMTITLSTLLKVLLITPFLVKMPVLGLHFWLPKAHVEASTSGSMTLAGVLLKLGSYGALRMWLAPFMAVNISIWLLLSLVASYLTMVQSDTKKFIAFSSVTHMTFMMIGLSCSFKFALSSVLLLSLAHGWASNGMFLMAGSLSHSTQTRAGVLSKTSSLNWIMLLLGVLLMVNSSIPPSPSFYPEMLMVTALSAINLKSTAIFIFLSFLVCYYNIYIFMWFTHTKPLTVSFNTLSMTEQTSNGLTILFALVTLVLIIFI